MLCRDVIKECAILVANCQIWVSLNEEIKVPLSPSVIRRLLPLKLLLIDEASLIPCDLLYFFISQIEKSHFPIFIVIVVDFYQLPPVCDFALFLSEHLITDEFSKLGSRKFRIFFHKTYFYTMFTGHKHPSLSEITVLQVKMYPF
jgi:hypothetical protein